MAVKALLSVATASAMASNAFAQAKITVEFGYDFDHGNPDTGFVHVPNTGVGDFVGTHAIAGIAGILFTASGTLNGVPLSFSVNDSDVHSIVFRTNPFGVSLDNYIPQGGHTLDRDAKDPFEVTQARAFFEVTTTEAVPEVGAPGLFLLWDSFSW